MKLIDGDRLVEKLEAFAALSQFGEDEMVEIGRIIAFVRDEPNILSEAGILVADPTNPIRYKLRDDSKIFGQMEWKFDDENN